jgi:hypothetical protein
VRTSGDENYIRAGLREPNAEETPGGAGAKDPDLHF